MRSPRHPLTSPERVRSIDPATTSAAEASELGRAVGLMMLSSILVPVAGLATQPILAHALGVGGRGALAAVLAPAALIVSVATLGLPDALTYYLAKNPWLSRRALLWTSVITSGAGLLCLTAAAAAAPFLSTGDPDLAALLLLACAFAVPTLVLGVFRGAAAGRQMWTEIAVERAANAALRIVSLAGLLLLDDLTVLTAMLASVLTPLVAGAVYWRLLLAPPGPRPTSRPGPAVRPLLSYGNRVWLGSIASMLLARLGQILMAPLSNVSELGIYTVASTVADVPLIVAVAISGALNGVVARSSDAEQVAATSRLSTIGGLLGCAVLAASLPLWIGPLFGDEFAVAAVPTLILLASAVLCVPGIMAAAGLSSAGRPGLRSAGLGVTLVVNLAAFLLLVPPLGAIGACVTSVLSNVVMTTAMVLMASRTLAVPARRFVIPEPGDVGRLVRHTRQAVHRLLKRPAQTGAE